MGEGERSVAQIPALTTLRFLPALWVVLHHYGHAAGSPSDRDRFLERGWMGVSLFFVLSGFILAVNYPEGRLSWRSFLAARFARIYPLYALGIVLMVPLYFQGRLYFLPLAGAVRETFVQTVASALLVQAWIPSRAALLNPVGWSLSAEAFFYVAFVPLLLWGASRKFLDRTATAAVALWIVGLAGTALWMRANHGLVPGPGMTDAQTRAANLHSFHPVLRLPEFALGIALGRFHLRGARLPAPGAVAATALLVLGAFVAFLPRSAEPYLHNMLAAPLFGAIILAIAQARHGWPRLLEGPVGVLLGESSYALYILHVPVHEWLRYACGKFAVPVDHPVVVGSYLVAVLAISVLAFRRLETPARIALRNVLMPRGRKP